MAQTTETTNTRSPAPVLSKGVTKFLSDVWTVLEMKILITLRNWYWYLFGALVVPASMFYWARAIAPDDPDAVRRMMVGAIVFGVSLNTVNFLASQMINDRFQGRLKLLITMPMSKIAYATGALAFATIQSASTLVLLLLFATIAGVDFTLNWAFFLVVVGVLLTMAGATLFLASYAPSAEVGNIITNLFSIVLIMISPVFFPIERAPLLIKWLGWVSPFRYAADGMTKALSGETDIWIELTILAGLAFVTMLLGLWKLRWREV